MCSTLLLLLLQLLLLQQQLLVALLSVGGDPQGFNDENVCSNKQEHN